MSEPDPEAPFGRKPDGTPYKRNPENYRRGENHPRSSGDDAKSPGRRKRSPVAPAVKFSTQERTRRVFEFLTIPVGAVAVAAQVTQNAPLMADAVVLGHAAPGLAEAVAKVAEQEDKFAQIVDNLISTGPYAALFGAVVPLVVQIAANHSARVANVAVGMGMAKSVDAILQAEFSRNESGAGNGEEAA